MLTIVSIYLRQIMSDVQINANDVELESFIQEYDNHPFPELVRIYRILQSTTSFVRTLAGTHVDYRLLLKCTLCVILSKTNSNRNAHMNSHTVKLFSFTQKKVQNECFISPGDFRVPKLPTELEPEFMSHLK